MKRSRHTRASRGRGRSVPGLPLRTLQLLVVMVSLGAPLTTPFAQDATAPTGSVVIVHARAWTLTDGADVPVEDATIVVRDGRIEAIGAGLPAPTDIEQVIDAGGAVVTPGLVDISTSVGLIEIWAVEGTRDLRAADTLRPAFGARDGYNPDSELIPVTRAEGVTSVVSAPSGGLISGRAVHCVLADGARTAQACADTDAYLAVNLGEAGAGASGGSRGEAIVKLREALEDARFHREHADAYDTNQSRKLSLGRADLEALQPVLDGQLPLRIDAHRASDIERALALATELGLATPMFAGATAAWQVADTLAASGATVLVDPLANLPSSFESQASRADNAALLNEAGVSVVISTFDSHNARNLRQSAGNAVRAGMPWLDALRAVTRTPATAVGRGSDLGQLAVGYRANLVLWSGDPFELSTRPEAVLIDGVVQSNASHQRALFERYEAPRLPTSSPGEP